MRRAAVYGGVLVLVLTLAPVAAASASRRADDFVAYASTTGRTRWRAAPTTTMGGFGVAYASSSTVYALQWKCSWMDSPHSSIRDTSLVALDSKTGRERWRVSGVDNGLSGDAAIVPDWVRDAAHGAVPVYFADRETLRALASRSGHELWTREVTGLAPAAGDESRIVLVSRQSRDGRSPASSTSVELIDRATGRTQWRQTLVGVGASVATVFGSDIGVPVTREDGTVWLAVLDARTGAIRREVVLPNVVNGGALHSDTAAGLFVISGSGVAAVDPASGEVQWSAPGTSGAFAPDGNRGTVIFSGRTTGPAYNVDALDATSGAHAWSAPENTVVYAADARETVFVEGGLWHQFGFASVVDTRTGAMKWTSSFSDDQRLLVAHGTLYVAGGCPPTLAD
jgi:hypothetical protein